MTKKFNYYDLIIYAARSSGSARRLASSIGCRRWRDDLPERYMRRRPHFRGNSRPVVVNWGSSNPADWLSDERFRIRPQWLNNPEACHRAIDKRTFFRVFSELGDQIPVLKATESRDNALKWLDQGFGVVARKTLSGSSGAGIVVVQPKQSLPAAPLYTRYYPKTHEFRAHIWRGELIDFTQKKLRNGHDPQRLDRTIRCLDNGWIHAHDDLDINHSTIATIGKSCGECVRVLGLDFGAVDILATLGDSGYPRKLRSFQICEVNTGPGLENSETIRAYTEAILNTYKKQTHAK